MTQRLGVFAALHGWLVADPERQERFDTWEGAVRAALRKAHLARWRGDEAEVVAQDQPGGPLFVIDPPPSPPRRPPSEPG